MSIIYINMNRIQIPIEIYLWWKKKEFVKAVRWIARFLNRVPDSIWGCLDPYPTSKKIRIWRGTFRIIRIFDLFLGLLNFDQYLLAEKFFTFFFLDPKSFSHDFLSSTLMKLQHNKSYKFLGKIEIMIRAVECGSGSWKLLIGFRNGRIRIQLRYSTRIRNPDEILKIRVKIDNISIFFFSFFLYL